MIKDLIMIIISYILIIGLSFGILAFLQAGFLVPFLKVKTSRGKKILIKIMKGTGSDFIAAQEIEGQLVFKYFKETKRINNYKKGIYRSYNVNCLDIDSETWGVVTSNFDAVTTNDPNKTDSLIERALLRPDKKATKEMIMIFLLVLIGVGIVFIVYKLNFLEQTINMLSSIKGTNI